MRRGRAAASILVGYLVLVAASCPVDRAAYNTLGTIKASVEGAVKEFGSQYQAGRRTEEDRLRVKALYEKWAASHKLAVDVARHGGSQDVVKTSLAAAADLLNLLETFGITRRT